MTPETQWAIIGMMAGVIAYLLRSRAETGERRVDKQTLAQVNMLERVVALETRMSTAPNATDLASLRREIGAVQNSVGRLEGQYQSIADQIRAIYENIVKGHA